VKIDYRVKSSWTLIVKWTSYLRTYLGPGTSIPIEPSAVRRFCSETSAVRRFCSETSAVRRFRSETYAVRRFWRETSAVRRFRSETYAVRRFWRETSAVRRFCNETSAVRRFHVATSAVRRFCSETSAVRRFHVETSGLPAVRRFRVERFDCETSAVRRFDCKTSALRRFDCETSAVKPSHYRDAKQLLFRIVSVVAENLSTPTKVSNKQTHGGTWNIVRKAERWCCRKQRCRSTMTDPRSDRCW
jgi:hypothetical protein